jgi:hypothetical protein
MHADNIINIYIKLADKFSSYLKIKCTKCDIDILEKWWRNIQSNRVEAIFLNGMCILFGRKEFKY